MKKSKQLMLMLLSLALVLSVCMSVFVACDNKGKTEYTVSVSECDQSKGTVVFDKEKVAGGGEVTMTVTSKPGYEIMKLYVNNADITDQFIKANNMTTTKDYTHGSYKFTVNKDTAVRALFQTEGTNSNTDYIYDLNCEYDNNKCYVNITPDRSKFANNESVTLSIELNNDFKLVSLLVNNEEHVGDVSGSNLKYTYTFNITQNSTIKVDVQFDTTVITNFPYDVTEDAFQMAINSADIVLCDFWATDCKPCLNIMGPSLNRLAGKAPIADVRIIKVQLRSFQTDTSSNAYKIKNRYTQALNNVGSFPFVVLFKNGEAVDAFNGAFPDQNTQDQNVLNFIAKNR